MNTPTSRNKDLEILAGTLMEDDSAQNTPDTGREKKKAPPKAKAKAKAKARLVRRTGETIH